MIGNDIIDLKLTLGKNTWKRTGFLNKLFSQEEQDFILRSSDPELTVWLLWAMKESAYKAHQRRLELPRKFNPKAFRCEITGDKITSVTGKVSIEKNSYLTKASISQEYIYCFATLENSTNFVQKIYLKPTDLKLELINEVSRLQNLPKQKISIKKSGQFIPFLNFENQKLFCNFSMTHHGLFSAFILELRN
ncbi:4'-phosphopantetheinyl transferase family protein [Gillisia limnaea]|jgi:phosphopantetheinyl transferase (holo-ACP synthase)|uniref:Holo-(Acyl-carrier-protein) synthase family protein n=1 Tax=Gillisia limnaea (strain DSM 15749 / LMG 21470 / R-8282) TaxID=865937 RepID=H2BQP6_GILLR|nr:4'-phosphopantetheinyl transferase superfamily protein [Gillisia limnaea]EHQ04215.1 holo-(acyl-carrier-protein) synthase family protein [Gillisia limnaea DSM 15749]